jgi:hypothetical protein
MRINKIDLAPFVGANLDVMKADTLRMRGKRPFIFTNLKKGEGADKIASFIIDKGGLAKSASLDPANKEEQPRWHHDCNLSSIPNGRKE